MGKIVTIAGTVLAVGLLAAGIYIVEKKVDIVCEQEALLSK